MRYPYIIVYATMPDIIMLLHFAVCLLDAVPCYALRSAMIIYCMST